MRLPVSNSNQPFAATAPVSAGIFPGRYRITDLGTSPDGLPLIPVALNDAGHLAVYGLSSAQRTRHLEVRGYLLQHGRCFEKGMACGGLPVTALSSNDLVAGHERQASGGPLRAWAAHLGAFGGRHWPGAESSATGVNRRGLVVGHVTFEESGRLARRVFSVDMNWEPLYLDPPQTWNAGAMAINDDGAVLINGACGWFEVDMRTWLWRDGEFVPVNGIGGGGTWGAALTPEGRVVGRLILHRGGMSAFLHHRGVTQPLNPGPGFSSEALAANDQPTVVGRMLDPAGQRHAFRWTPVDGMRQLADLVPDAAGWVFQKAVAVNATGQIAGSGVYDGQRRGFLLTPA